MSVREPVNIHAIKTTELYTNLSPKYKSFMDHVMKSMNRTILAGKPIDGSLSVGLNGKTVAYTTVVEWAVELGFEARLTRQLLGSPTIIKIFEMLDLLVKMPIRQLTDSQIAFVDHYMETFDPKQAAISAGFNELEGKRLLRQIDVKYAIQLRQDALGKSSEITAARLLLEYAKIGFADISDIVSIDDNGFVALKPLEEIDSASISELSNGKYGPVIKLHSKVHALDAMAKMLGLFRERIEITGKDGKELTLISPVETLTKLLSDMNANKDSLSEVDNRAKEVTETDEDSTEE